MRKNTKHTGQGWRILHQIRRKQVANALRSSTSSVHPSAPIHSTSIIIYTSWASSQVWRVNWLKRGLIFSLLFQAWRAKDGDENELKILTDFQKQERATGKESQHQNDKALAFRYSANGCFLFPRPVSSISWGEGMTAAWPLWPVRQVTLAQRRKHWKRLK